MVIWKLGIKQQNPAPTDFETRWFARRTDARAATPDLQKQGYKILMLEKVYIPMRDGKALISWLNQHAR